jgi:hypothetical protein
VARSFGCFPPSGTPNSAASSGQFEPPHRLLAEPGAALRERRPGRDRRARPHPRPGHRERPGQDHVIALAGEEGPRCQQVPDQPVPAQFGEPVLVIPEPRAGRGPGRELIASRQRIGTLASGNSRRHGERAWENERTTKLLRKNGNGANGAQHLESAERVRHARMAVSGSRARNALADCDGPVNSPRTRHFGCHREWPRSVSCPAKGAPLANSKASLPTAIVQERGTQIRYSAVHRPHDRQAMRNRPGRKRRL